MQQPRIGLAGIGRMGSAIGDRILAAGFPLAVYNRTAARVAPLIDAGATHARSLGELVSASDIILTVLTDDAAVDSVYADLLDADVTGRLFIDASTVRASTIARLADRVRSAGAGLVDAPLAGPPAAARAGQLLVMCGGTESDVATATPAIEAYARRIVHVGPVGAGTTMKLVLMAPMGAYFAALAEGLAVGERLGLDRSTMLDVILDSHTAPPLLRDRAAVLLGGGAVGFDVAGVRKDLRAIIATGQDAAVPMSTAAAALAHFAGAAAHGFGDRDLIFIVDYVRRLAESGDVYLGSS
ncbi:MAG TPA: NAD(P)-dependent oxidoreductase [Micromonosporaceae bacterium]